MNQCEKFVLDPIPHNQYRPIGLKLNAVLSHRTTPFKQRFNLKKVVRKIFADSLDSSITDLPTTPNNYNAFVKLLNASSKNIPRGCCTNFIQGLPNDVKELYEEYTQFFEDNPLGTDGDTLINSIVGNSQEVASVD